MEVIEKVKEKTPVEFLIQKPTRKLYDKAELFYGVKMSEGIKAGLLTRNLLAKRYEDDGGAFSEVEKRRYSELYLAIYNKEEEYQRLQLNLDNKGQEQKEQLSQDLLYELSDLRRELTEIENSQSNIFDQTAENRAKNQTIMWWVLQLSHWKEFQHKGAENFFQGKTFDEKLDSYDEKEEDDDDFMGEAIRKLAYFISFWYMGRINSEEDFKGVEDLYNSQNEPPEEDSEADEDTETEGVAEAKEKHDKEEVSEVSEVVEDVAEPLAADKPVKKAKPKPVKKATKKRVKKSKAKNKEVELVEAINEVDKDLEEAEATEEELAPTLSRRDRARQASRELNKKMKAETDRVADEKTAKHEKHLADEKAARQAKG